MIQDPEKLLPKTISEQIKLEDRVLEIPPHGIPLLKKSVEKLVNRVNAETETKIIIFRPSLPVTSELGLSPYPILAYLYPKQFSPIWTQLRQQLEVSNQKNIFDHLPCIVLGEIDRDEQLYYFADYYGQVSQPSYIRAIVGNTCNLQCVMCPYHSSLLKPSHTTDFFQGNKMMSWTLMDKLAKDCGKAGVSVLIGSIEEPLLHPQLIDFIQLCRQQGVPQIHLTTNGQFLDETCAEALLKAGLTSIDISIDAATPETYQKIRGGNFSRIKSNVINFLKIRDRLGNSCEVRTSFVRNKEVTSEEEKLFLNYWIPKVNSVFVLNLAEYQNNNLQLKQTNQVGYNSLQFYQEKAQGRWTCLFPFTEMAVLPDGRIYYCIETLFRLGFDNEIKSLGDYNQQTLQDIWSGNLFQQLRRDLILNQLQERSVCQTCNSWMSQVINKKNTNKYQVLTTITTEIYSQI